MEGRTRWQKSRWMWSTSLSMDTSGIHLQTQKCMRALTSLEQTGVPDQWKRIQNHGKLGRRKELGVLVGPDLPSVGGGTEAEVRSPHRGNCLNQRRNI